jgi:uncharacterized protein (DUF39 family)
MAGESTDPPIACAILMRVRQRMFSQQRSKPVIRMHKTLMNERQVSAGDCAGDYVWNLSETRNYTTLKFLPEMGRGAI